MRALIETFASDGKKKNAEERRKFEITELLENR